MLFIAPGDLVATPRTRRSEQRSANAELVATARTGQLAHAAQPLPTPMDDASLPRMLAGVVAALLLWAAFGWGIAELARGHV